MLNKKENLLTLIAFPLVSLIIFYPTRKNGFVTDFLGWAYHYRDEGFVDALKNFGYPGFHQVLEIFNWSLFQLVEFNPFWWYFFFAILHGFNTYMLFRLVKRLCDKFQINIPETAYIASVLFLISPYQLEAVNWRVCFHYLLVLQFLFWGIKHLLDYFEFNKRASLIYCHLFFVLSLFTLEISYVFPFVYLAYWLLFQNENRQYLINIFLVQIGLLALQFVSLKLFIGQWIGHYGAETHLDLNPDLWIANLFLYPSKYLFLIHYLKHDAKSEIYSVIGSPQVYWILLVILLLIAGISLLRLNKLSNKFKLILFSVASYFLCLAPVITLFFQKLMPYENDRYGYVASAFLFCFLAFILQYIPRWSRMLLFSILLIANLWCLKKSISDAKIAGNLCYDLVENFKWYDAERIVLLNLVDNVNGISVYRDFTLESIGFQEGLEFINKRKYEGEMKHITQFNMLDGLDPFKAEVIDENKLQVAFDGWGRWFWIKSLGGGNYEDDEFKIEFKTLSTGLGYDLIRKKKIPGTVFLLQQGNRWEEINW